MVKKVVSQAQQRKVGCNKYDLSTYVNEGSTIGSMSNVYTLCIPICHPSFPDRVNCYDYDESYYDSNYVTSCKDCPSKKGSCSGDCKWNYQSYKKQCVKKKGNLIYYFSNIMYTIYILVIGFKNL